MLCVIDRRRQPTELLRQLSWFTHVNQSSTNQCTCICISGVEQLGGNKGGTYTVGSIAEDVEETEEDDGVGLNITGYSSGFLSEFCTHHHLLCDHMVPLF